MVKMISAEDIIHTLIYVITLQIIYDHRGY